MIPTRSSRPHFLNPMRIKGIHLSMKSAMLAAEAAFDALVRGDASETVLAEYANKVEHSWIKTEMESFNASGGKLDFYLTRAVSYERTGCGAFRDVLVTIKLSNYAPPAGLPPYVYSRLDDAPPSAQQGDYRSLVDLYASPGAELQSVTLNGEPGTASVEHDLGHPMFRFDLELPRGQTQTVAVHLREPAGTGSPWRSPRSPRRRPRRGWRAGCTRRPRPRRSRRSSCPR